MDLLSWLEEKCGLTPHLYDDHVDLSDANSEYSTLWFASPAIGSTEVQPLHALYGPYDGADLFGSAFKIASDTNHRYHGSIRMTPTLSTLREQASFCGAPLAGITWFMVNTGGWLYGLSLSTGDIVEWDCDEGAESGTYPDLASILEEWLINVRGSDA